MLHGVAASHSVEIAWFATPCDMEKSQIWTAPGKLIDDVAAKPLRDLVRGDSLFEPSTAFARAESSPSRSSSAMIFCCLAICALPAIFGGSTPSAIGASRDRKTAG
jgi:hypothetical protein